MYVLRRLLCIVSAAVAIDAELDETSLDDMSQTENVIVSQWRDISADEQHELRDRFDEILRPLGFETSLIVIRRANSIALYFICLTLSAVMSLRDHWRSQLLKHIVEQLFTFLHLHLHRTVHVKRLNWPRTDYEQCLKFFIPAQRESYTLQSAI